MKAIVCEKTFFDFREYLKYLDHLHNFYDDSLAYVAAANKILLSIFRVFKGLVLIPQALLYFKI